MKKSIVMIGLIALGSAVSAQVINSSSVDLEFSGMDREGASIKADGLVDNQPVGYLQLTSTGEGVVLDYDFGSAGTTRSMVVFMAGESIIRTISDNSGPAPYDIEIDHSNSIISSTVVPTEEFWPVALLAAIACSHIDFTAQGGPNGTTWTLDIQIGCGDGQVAPVDIDFNGTIIRGVTSVGVVPLDGDLELLSSVSKIALSAAGGARITSAR